MSVSECNAVRTGFSKNFSGFDEYKTFSQFQSKANSWTVYCIFICVSLFNMLGCK